MKIPIDDYRLHLLACRNELPTPKQPSASPSGLFPESPVEGTELHEAQADVIRQWKAAAPRLHKHPWGEMPPEASRLCL